MVARAAAAAVATLGVLAVLPGRAPASASLTSASLTSASPAPASPASASASFAPASAWLAPASPASARASASLAPASPASARAPASLAPASAWLYWAWANIPANTSVANSGISAVGLDGQGGTALPLGAGTAQHPLGEAIDAATGMLYWVNFGSSINYCTGALSGGNTISYAKLDGSGAGTLNTQGATVSGPDGLAIDPAARRIYWANDHGNSISYANLDGSGGGDLNTAGATLSCPAGIAIDPAFGRVYWTNLDGNTISYANLDGSGGGDLPIAPSTISGPWGLAIDTANGKLYWANFDGDSIGYSNLDGSGAGILGTSGAPLTGPWGVAIDPAAGLVYWANNLGATLSYARLDGTGGGVVATGAAPVDHPKYPILLEPPSGAGAPVITGGGTIGSRLSCSPGTWAADLVESFLYRAPQSLGYQWLRDGAPTGSSSNTTSALRPGSYTCQVTASNFAGSSSMASASFAVTAPASNAVSVGSWRISKRGAITLRVSVSAPGALTGTATFRQRVASGAGKRRHRLSTGVYGTATATASAAGTAILTIEETRRARARIRSGRPVTVVVALTFTRVDGALAHSRVRVEITAR